MNCPPLLILGAGASRPYSLPTSAELRHIILGGPEGTKALIALGVPWQKVSEYLDEKYLDEDEKVWVQHWNKSGRLDLPEEHPVARLFVDVAFRRWTTPARDIREHDISEFRKRFFESQRVSIDAFAQRNNGYFEAMAKIAVAAIILLCERDERLEGDWYQQLVEAIFRHEEGFMALGLRVISFNYDRSFERYLQRAFEANFLSRPELAKQYFDKIEVVHPYGVLGTLDRQYGRLGGLRAATDNLKLARGAANSEQGWGDGFYIGISSTTFIGFSFWPENIDVLRLAEIPKDKPILATACGLPLPVQDDMVKLLPGITFGGNKELALQFVTNRRVFSFQPD